MLLIPLLFLIFFLGFEITVSLGIKVAWPERLSLSFLLGIGISTFVTFLLAFIFNLNFSLINTFVILITLSFLGFFIKLKESIYLLKSIKFKKLRLSSKTVLFWGFVIAIFAFTLLVNIYWPISDWDAFAMYDFRAKLFMIDTNLVHAALNNGYFLAYPLLTSLGHLFVYQVGISNPKFIYSLMYLSFIVIFYFSLRKNISENKAIIFTILLSLVPEIFAHAAMAYTNLPYVVYLCTGTLYLYEWIKSRQLSTLLLSAFLVGLSSWVRGYEPFWLAPAFVVFVVAVIYKKWKEIIFYILIILAISLPWKLFVSYISHVPTPIAGATGDVYYNSLKNITFANIYLITKFLIKYVFLPMGLVPFAFILAFAGSLSEWKSRKYVFFYITLLFIALLFAGTLIFSVTFSEWQTIPESAARLSMFLIPFMIYSIALSLEPRHGNNK